jgi:hypothetical protein
MGNECEVCDKHDDDSNRRNQVSVKMGEEQKSTQSHGNLPQGK